jgi:hypothetical protein
MIHPKSFADRYIAVWNGADIEGILKLYEADAELRSPFAKLFARTGIVKGAAELRAFCEETFRRRPGMKLDLIDTFGGHDAVSLHLRDEVGRSTVFTALFSPAGRIQTGILCYNRGVQDTA